MRRMLRLLTVALAATWVLMGLKLAHGWWRMTYVSVCRLQVTDAAGRRMIELGDSRIVGPYLVLFDRPGNARVQLLSDAGQAPPSGGSSPWQPYSGVVLRNDHNVVGAAFLFMPEGNGSPAESSVRLTNERGRSLAVCSGDTAGSMLTVGALATPDAALWLLAAPDYRGRLGFGGKYHTPGSP